MYLTAPQLDLDRSRWSRRRRIDRHGHELRRQRLDELRLRRHRLDRRASALSVDDPLAQRELVQQYVAQLEKQLPSKAEMAALLSDVNHAGVGRGVQFDLFRPGSENIKEYYAELTDEWILYPWQRVDDSGDTVAARPVLQLS